MNKLSAVAALCMGLAGGIAAGVMAGPAAPAVQDVPAAGTAASTTRAGCVTTRPTRNLAPTVQAPANTLPDRQMNSSGTGATGAGGTVADRTQIRGDPCAPANNRSQRRANDAADAASAADATRP